VTLHLPPPQLLEIEGPDAAAFAHAQFTSDVQALPPRHWQWSAWLSAQGRVRAMFRLLRPGADRFCLYLAGGSAEALRSTLAPFVLRAKVTLRLVGRQAIGGFAGDDAAALVGTAPHGDVLVERAASIAFAISGDMPRWCAIGDFGAAAPLDRSALERWRAADIADGLAELGDAQRERFLPDGLGLGTLGAVSVRKGCYPGQEIVARLHFKGGNKRWLHRLEYESAAPPQAGMLLSTSSGTGDGELLNSAAMSPGHGVALAVLPELPAGTILQCAALPGSKFRVVSAIGVASA
jgi:folate-binding protein YgfZ